MKKSVFLLFVLFILSMAGVVCVSVHISKEEEQVQLKENILYGEVSEVEDLTITTTSHYSENLFWKTVYEPGKNPTVKTEFEFYTLEQEHNPPAEFIGVSLDNYISHSFLENKDAYEGLELAYKELYDKTAPGEEHSKIIYLRDYIEFYPISGWLEFSDIHMYWDQYMTENSICRKVTDCFRIPVLEEETKEISITKNSDGKVVSMGEGHTEGDSFYLMLESVVVNQGCYFSFSTRTNNGNIIDTSYLSEGYGIYYLTYTKEENKIKDISLSMVYEIDPSVQFIDIYSHQEDSRILVVTIENGKYILTILEQGTHELVQRMELGEAESVYATYIYDDFLVQCLSENQLTLVETMEDGTYEQQFTIEYADVIEPFYYLSAESVMDWNGEQLVIGGYCIPEDSYMRGNDFYLAVYGDTGLQYFAEYESSLTTGERFGDYDYYVRPIDYEPLSIMWS